MQDLKGQKQEKSQGFIEQQEDDTLIDIDQVLMASWVRNTKEFAL